MEKSNKKKLWIIFGGEERPLALIPAKTEYGAKRKYEKRTGNTRYGVYAEQVKFDKGIYRFVNTT